MSGSDERSSARHSSPTPGPRFPLPVIGLLGGVASGKSLVARELEALGAAILDADRAGHEVLKQPEVKQAVRERWGEAVFGPDGEIDRRRLAQIVFAPPPHGQVELEYLEQLTHPRIAAALHRQAEEIARTGRASALVLDAPVMLKAGWHAFCDRVLFVDATREVRLARARSRGWREAEFNAREAAQESLETKRRFADEVINNSGSVESTKAQVERFWRSFIG